jgi:hypothetical protein
LDILESKETTRKFKEYLKAKHCDENLYFWVDAEMYVNPSITPSHQLQGRAASIYCKYFGDRPKYRMNNMDSEIVQQITWRFDNRQIDRTLYKAAQAYVFKVMEVSSVRDFLAEVCRQEVKQKQMMMSLRPRLPRRAATVGGRLKKQKDVVQLSAESLNLETFFLSKQNPAMRASMTL